MELLDQHQVVGLLVVVVEDIMDLQELEGLEAAVQGVAQDL
jgi:hypothetical protein